MRELDEECVEAFARVLHQAARETWEERYDADRLDEPSGFARPGNLLAGEWEGLSDGGREHFRHLSRKVALIYGAVEHAVPVVLAAVAAGGLVV